VKSRLYVLQHGDAVTKQEDPERPLSPIGCQDVERLAEYLTSKDVLIQRIIHSGKLRAEQSAQIIAEKLAPEVTPEKYSGISPNDDAAIFVKNIDIEKESVLIASHMPFVANLSSILLSGTNAVNLSFSPGTIACFEHHNDVWSLKCMISPDHL